MALDGNSRWCYLDPKLGAMHAVAESARNVACTGATPVGATNCLNFGNPEKPHIMWQFSQAIDGITKACEELDVPITGGNVSFYNETLGEGIYPTPVIGIVGILEDVHKAVGPHFREPGRVIVLLRPRSPATLPMPKPSLARPSMPRRSWDRSGDSLRRSNWSEKPPCRRRIIEMIGAGLVESAHDCSEGGIAVTLAESAFGKGIGLRANLPSMGLPPEFVLFGEDASRVVISCDRSKLRGIQRVAEKYRLVCGRDRRDGFRSNRDQAGWASGSVRVRQ